MDLDADADELPAAPPIVPHVTFGINEVTKRLESQANSRRVRSFIRAPSIPDAAEEVAPALTAEHPCLTHVFVCRADVDPPLLISHLPETCRSMQHPFTRTLAEAYTCTTHPAAQKCGKHARQSSWPPTRVRPRLRRMFCWPRQFFSSRTNHTYTSPTTPHSPHSHPSSLPSNLPALHGLLHPHLALLPHVPTQSNSFVLPHL